MKLTIKSKLGNKARKATLIKEYPNFYLFLLYGKTENYMKCFSKVDMGKKWSVKE